MIPILEIFEAHLTVSNLRRSMAFYGGVLGLELAQVVAERKIAFYWIGGRGMSMLGLWEVETVTLRPDLHVAFRVELADVLRAPETLRAANLEPLDFVGNPCDEPVVLAWMPAASLYFRDADGNLLEFLAMLPDAPEPKLGVVSWSEWSRRHSRT